MTDLKTPTFASRAYALQVILHAAITFSEHVRPLAEMVLHGSCALGLYSTLFDVPSDVDLLLVPLHKAEGSGVMSALNDRAVSDEKLLTDFLNWSANLFDQYSVPFSSKISMVTGKLLLLQFWSEGRKVADIVVTPPCSPHELKDISEWVEVQCPLIDTHGSLAVLSLQELRTRMETTVFGTARGRCMMPVIAPSRNMYAVTRAARRLAVLHVLGSVGHVSCKPAPWMVDDVVMMEESIGTMATVTSTHLKGDDREPMLKAVVGSVQACQAFEELVSARVQHLDLLTQTLSRRLALATKALNVELQKVRGAAMRSRRAAVKKLRAAHQHELVIVHQKGRRAMADELGPQLEGLKAEVAGLKKELQAEKDAHAGTKARIRGLRRAVDGCVKPFVAQFQECVSALQSSAKKKDHGGGGGAAGSASASGSSSGSGKKAKTKEVEDIDLETMTMKDLELCELVSSRVKHRLILGNDMLGVDAGSILDVWLFAANRTFYRVFPYLSRVLQVGTAPAPSTTLALRSITQALEMLGHTVMDTLVYGGALLFTEVTLRPFLRSLQDLVARLDVSLQCALDDV